MSEAFTRQQEQSCNVSILRVSEPGYMLQLYVIYFMYKEEKLAMRMRMTRT